MAITVKHLKVSAIPDSGDDTLIEPSDWNADHQLVGTVPVANGGTGAATLTGYVKGNGTSAMTAASTIPNTDITGLGTASTKDAGAALGVATLDASGKVPVSELPAAVLGALSYQGTWNASTNTPTLTSGVGTKGYYYVVSVAGSTDLDGITDWVVGDWAVYNGTAWQQIDNTDAVTSVNGQTGAVVLTTTNIAEGTNEYFTQARARASISAGTGISYDNSTGVVTNSAPDQTVALSDGTGIDVTGTYPNFTITNTAPDQVVALTGAGTTSISGTYPNFTITSNDEFDGDVVGPASATDNAIARFDSTTGKLIQNSVVTIDDAGNEAGINSITFDTTPTTVPTTEGSLYWDSADGNQTLSLVMAGGTAVQQIGEEQFYRIKASSAITDGQVVMFTGSVGASGALTGAPATGLTASTASYIMGIATQDIPLNSWGYVTSFGLVRQLNTSAFADGDILYYDPTVTGGLTTSIPAAPNAKVQVCAVTHAASNGSLFVRLSFGGILGQYEGDVQVTTPANGDLLIRNQTSGKWVNAPLTAGTGVSIGNAAGAVTVTNTAPDQTVAITGAGGAVVTGTYPNFTITTPSGTVTSVTGTAPIASSGGATPAISISQATTSTDGYLSSTDWNTFNSKGPAVTYTTSYVPFGQGTTTPNLSSSFTYVTGTGTLTAPAVSASNGLVVNSNTVAASYSIPSGSSAMSAGPMTVASGQTVTIPSGSRWVVL